MVSGAPFSDLKARGVVTWSKDLLTLSTHYRDRLGLVDHDLGLSSDSVQVSESKHDSAHFLCEGQSATEEAAQWWSQLGCGRPGWPHCALPGEWPKDTTPTHVAGNTSLDYNGDYNSDNHGADQSGWQRLIH